MTFRARGFILQATYRVESEIPVVHLYGRLEDGRSFLVRDDRQIPCFYIRSEDAKEAQRLGAQTRSSSSSTMDGSSATRVEVDIPAHVPPLRNRLHSNGIRTYESDVRFATLYLIRRNVRGGCVISGDVERTSNAVDAVFQNPTIEPADVTYVPRVLSFDIETDPRAQQLLAISMYGPEIDEVLIVNPEGRVLPSSATSCDDEGSALEEFSNRIREHDPDVLTGWNVIDFDLTVLQRIARRLRVPFKLGRDSSSMSIRKAQGYFGSGQANIPGRLVLDGMDLVRGAFIRFPEYSLDAVSQEVLGEGKAVEGDVRNRADEIMNRYQTDLEGFAKYARTDARLAYQIVDRLSLIPLCVARSRLTGMTLDRVAASIASFDFVFLSELSKEHIRAPSVESSDSRVSERHAGGHVFEPEPGIHENVWTFDFKSLYPSVIRTFNIDPVSYLTASSSPDPIQTVSDVEFSRDQAILPTFLDRLFEEREDAKRRGDEVASQAIKILMNSFYGVLATPACRFHNGKLANAITATGRFFLHWARDWFEERGYRVLYGDTDSVFVRSGIVSSDQADETGRKLEVEFNDVLHAYVRDRWSVSCKMQLELEKLYEMLFLPSVRRGSSGARKRYAGLINSTGQVEFVGMESVRSDWTELAKEIQRELYTRLFTRQKVDEYLRNCVAALHDGQFDEKLVYRKRLGKPLSEYRKTTPPHVAAARKSGNSNRMVEYVITVDGPEPIDRITHKLDLKHYEDKQIRSVAEPVLKELGLEFDAVVGNIHELPLL